MPGGLITVSNTGSFPAFTAGGSVDTGSFPGATIQPGILNISVSGSWTGTLHVYATADNIQCDQLADALIFYPKGNSYGAITANGLYAIGVPGGVAYVVAGSGFSGTANVNLTLGAQSGSVLGGGGGGGDTPTQPALNQIVKSATTTFTMRGSPGNLHSYKVWARESLGYWVSFFNETTTPTTGDTPSFSVQLPGGGSATLPAIMQFGADDLGASGIEFSNGIGMAINTTSGNLVLPANTANYDISATVGATI